MVFWLLEIASVDPGHDPWCPLVPVSYAFTFARCCSGARLTRLAVVDMVPVWCPLVPAAFALAHYHALECNEFNAVTCFRKE